MVIIRRKRQLIRIGKIVVESEIVRLIITEIFRPLFAFDRVPIGMTETRSYSSSQFPLPPGIVMNLLRMARGCVFAADRAAWRSRFFRDDIDHAAHRVRSVQRARRSAEDFNSFHLLQIDSLHGARGAQAGARRLVRRFTTVN